MRGLPDVRRRTFQDAFERALDAKPEACALRDRSGSCTYADSHDRALRIAAGLSRLGVRAPDAVSWMLDNSLDTVLLWWGLGLTGMVQVPVNTAYRASFLSHVLNDSGATVLVVEDHYCARLADIADQLRRLRTVVVRGGPGDALPRGRFRVVRFAELEAAEPHSPRRADPSDLFAIMYTSGTTGRAKGVLVPQAHAYTYASREDEQAPTHEDTLLVTLPLFHLAGQWYGVYQSLIHRASCVLEPAFSPSRFWDVVRENDVTFTVLLGAMAELLQQQPPSTSDADNPLRLAVMAPLASDVDGFRRRFGVDLAAVYGMSECGAVLTGPPHTVVSGEAGFARPGYDLRVVDEDGADVRTGEVGELLVRPEVPHTVMSGYHNLPERTAETFRDGWLHTGDAFRLDEQGRFYFCDRMKDALRRRGENVSSFEVERAINEHPAVYESAVVGVPSELTEDDIKAVVVARQGRLDPADLVEFLRDRLPYFMVPRYIELTEELPKTPTQKVRKHLLREAGEDGEVWDREAAGIHLRRGD